MPKKTNVDIWLKGETSHIRKALENASSYFDKNNARFDIDYAAIAAARYMDDFDRAFSKKSILSAKIKTEPVKNALERKKFILAAYNGGEGTIAKAQALAKEGKKDPASWNDVQQFLEGAEANDPDQIRAYVTGVFKNEAEFSDRSSADKSAKDRKINKFKRGRTKCHWVTIDDHPVFICK